MDKIRKVATNVDLLRDIFDLLTLQEQIQITSVCQQYEYIVEHFIWKTKFQEIKITEPEDGFYVGFSDATDTEYYLTESEYNIFMPIMARHIKKLIITKKCREKVTDVYQFENLISLEFHYTTITLQNLKSLPTHCPKVEKINFINCDNVNYSSFDLNKRGQLENLSKVKSLKHLNLAANIYFDISQLNEILNKLCLKSLTLQVYLYPDEVENVEEIKVNNIESLNIDCCYETGSWLQIEDLYLKSFKNLTSLSLLSREALFKDSNMSALAESCTNLSELTLIEWNIFIKQFPQQLRLKKLKFKECKQLTWKNLQQILAELNLEEFISEESEYEGRTEFFYDNCKVANTLQLLDIKTKQNTEFMEFFKYVNDTPERLKIFRYEFTKNSPFLIFKNFLKLCLNLEELSITNVGLPIKDLMHLSSLKSLKFYVFPSITWSDLSTLLSHSSLIDIFLEMSEETETKVYADPKKNNSYEDENNNDETEDDLAGFDLQIVKNKFPQFSLDCSNLETKLQTIRIPFIIFHKQPDLFLDLLNFQKSLKVTLSCYSNFVEMLNQIFLKKLLNNKKFPDHKKYIKILKKYYDCNDLKENFATTVDDVSETSCLLLTI